MHPDYLYMTMILGGFITLNMIFLFATFVVSKAVKMRVSGASIIASMVCGWPTILGLGALFPVNVQKGWVAALFILLALFSYLFWLWVFQPQSLHSMIKANLKQKELECLDIRKDGLKKQLAQFSKGQEFEAERKTIKEELFAIKFKRREIKKTYSNSNPVRKMLNAVFNRLLSKKLSKTKEKTS